MSQKQKLSSKNKRRAKIALFIIALGGVILFSLPYAIRYGLEQWLLKNGAQSAQIDRVRLNLFTGTAAIEGLNAELANNIVLADQDLNINLQLTSLFKKEGHLKTGRLSGLILDIELFEDGSLRIGSITTPASDTSAQQDENDTKSAWNFRINHFELDNCMVRFTMPHLQKTLHISHAVVNNLFTGSSEQPSLLELRGDISGAPIHIVLDKIDLSSGIATGGHIKIEKYGLDQLSDLLGEVLSPFAGIAGLDGDIAFSMSKENGLRTDYQGDINLDTGKIGNSGFKVESPGISYSGDIIYQQTQQSGISIAVNGKLQGKQLALDIPPASLHLDEQQIILDGKTAININEGVSVTTDGTLTGDTFALNLQSLQAGHSALQWKGNVAYNLKNGGGQDVSAQGKLTVTKPEYSGQHGELVIDSSSDAVSWEGDGRYFLGSEKSNLHLQGTLTGEHLDLDMPQLVALQEESLQFSGKTDLTIAPALQIAHDGKLALGPMQLSNPQAKVESEKISWQGKTEYELASQNIRIHGELQANDLTAVVADKTITIQQKAVTSRAEELALRLDKQLQVTGKASLDATQTTLSGSDGSFLLTLEETAINNAASNTKTGLSIGSLSVSGIKLPKTEKQAIDAAVAKISLNNITSSDFKNIAAESLEIHQPLATDPQKKLILADLDVIKGKHIAFSPESGVSLASLKTDHASFLTQEDDPQKPQITLNTFLAEKIAWSQKAGFSTDNIVLDSFFADISREKSEKKEPQKEAPPEKEEKTEKGAPYPIKINTVSITGKSGFQFNDASTSIPFLTKLLLEKGVINNISSVEPDTPFTYEIQGKFDEYSPLHVSGSCAPFAAAMQLETKTSLKNYSMQQLSPYVIDAVGTSFQSGQLNLDSHLTIQGQKLASKNTFDLKQLKLSTVSEEQQNILTKSLPVPLDMALYMLRDSNGDIKLRVPVSGTLSSLRVNPTHLIVTAISKALVTAVTPYLAYTALGPTGAIAYLGMKMGSSMLNANLPSLEFEPRSYELTEEDKKKLEEIGKTIKKDKKQEYSICSRVLLWELSDESLERNLENQRKILEDETQRKELLDLAGKRAENVRDYLRKKFSIDKDRLLICSPTVNFDPKGVPSVNFLK